MDTIYLKDLTSDFYSGISGMRVGNIIDEYLKKQQHITLSLLGVQEMSPSFINGVFLYPMELYGIGFVKQYLKVVQATPTIAREVKDAINVFEQQQRTFFESAITNTVYLTTDGSLEGLLMQNNLNTLKEQGIRILTSEKPVDEVKILHADFIIGIITDNHYRENVINEVNFAMKHGKKTLLICKEGVAVQNKGKYDKSQIIRYSSFQEITRAVNEFVLRKKIAPANTKKLQSQNTHTNTEVLAWTALGILTVFLMSVLFSDINNKK